MNFQNQRFNKLAERYLARIETICAFYRGKGWGAATVQYEVKQIAQLSGDVKPSLAIDIGGNKGLYTQELLGVFPGISVIIFEPAKPNLRILEERFVGDNVKIEPNALSKDSGTATLFSDEPGSGLASLTKRRLDHHGKQMSLSEDVRTLRFEDYWAKDLEKREIDICKIDVEGHELDVLLGFGEAINHTRLIQFEFGGTNIDTRVFFQDFWYFFKDNGFKIFRLTPFGRTEIKRYREDLECFSISNFVAIKS